MKNLWLGRNKLYEKAETIAFDLAVIEDKEQDKWSEEDLHQTYYQFLDFHQNLGKFISNFVLKIKDKFELYLPIANDWFNNQTTDENLYCSIYFIRNNLPFILNIGNYEFHSGLSTEKSFVEIEFPTHLSFGLLVSIPAIQLEQSIRENWSSYTKLKFWIKYAKQYSILYIKESYKEDFEKQIKTYLLGDAKCVE